MSSTFSCGSLSRQPSVKKIIIPTLRNVPRREGEYHVRTYIRTLQCTFNYCLISLFQSSHWISVNCFCLLHVPIILTMLPCVILYVQYVLIHFTIFLSLPFFPVSAFLLLPDPYICVTSLFSLLLCQTCLCQQLTGSFRASLPTHLETSPPRPLAGHSQVLMSAYCGQSLTRRKEPR